MRPLVVALAVAVASALMAGCQDAGSSTAVTQPEAPIENPASLNDLVADSGIGNVGRTWLDADSGSVWGLWVSGDSTDSGVVRFCKPLPDTQTWRAVERGYPDGLKRLSAATMRTPKTGRYLVRYDRTKGQGPWGLHLVNLTAYKGMDKNPWVLGPDFTDTAVWASTKLNRQNIDLKLDPAWIYEVRLRLFPDWRIYAEELDLSVKTAAGYAVAPLRKEGDSVLVLKQTDGQAVRLSFYTMRNLLPLTLSVKKLFPVLQDDTLEYGNIGLPTDSTVQKRVLTWHDTDECDLIGASGVTAQVQVLEPGPVALELLDSANHVIARDSGTATRAASVKAPALGVARSVRVTGVSASPDGAYSIVAWDATGGVVDAFEPDNSPDKASVMQPGSEQQHFSHRVGDLDHVKVPVKAGTTVTVTVTADPRSTAHFLVRDSANGKLWNFRNYRMCERFSCKVSALKNDTLMVMMTGDRREEWSVKAVAETGIDTSHVLDPYEPQNNHPETAPIIKANEAYAFSYDASQDWVRFAADSGIEYDYLSSGGLRTLAATRTGLYPLQTWSYSPFRVEPLYRKDTLEPDGPGSKAPRILADGTVHRRSIYFGGDTDWVCFRLEPGLRYSVRLPENGIYQSTNINTQDSLGKVLQGARCDTGECYGLAVARPTTLWLQVASTFSVRPEDYKGNYSLQLSSTAMRLDTLDRTKALVDSVIEDVRAYALHVAAGEIVTVKAEQLSADRSFQFPHLDILDENGLVVDASDHYDFTTRTLTWESPRDQWVSVIAKKAWSPYRIWVR